LAAAPQEPLHLSVEGKGKRCWAVAGERWRRGREVDLSDVLDAAATTAVPSHLGQPWDSKWDGREVGEEKKKIDDLLSSPPSVPLSQHFAHLRRASW
jgi:hypothetical protein